MTDFHDGGVRQFTAAPPGWRVALKHRRDRDVTVVPLVGWAVLREGARRTQDMAVEPVIFWGNVGDPIVCTVAATVGDGKEWEMHQILEPDARLRKVPQGWQVRMYGVL